MELYAFEFYEKFPSVTLNFFAYRLVLQRLKTDDLDIGDKHNVIWSQNAIIEPWFHVAASYRPLDKFFYTLSVLYT